LVRCGPCRCLARNIPFFPVRVFPVHPLNNFVCAYPRAYFALSAPNPLSGS
jgi:hypothetical protein